LAAGAAAVAAIWIWWPSDGTRLARSDGERPTSTTATRENRAGVPVPDRAAGIGSAAEAGAPAAPSPAVQGSRPALVPWGSRVPATAADIVYQPPPSEATPSAAQRRADIRRLVEVRRTVGEHQRRLEDPDVDDAERRDLQAYVADELRFLAGAEEWAKAAAVSDEEIRAAEAELDRFAP
jgi:hypothetical protein